MRTMKHLIVITVTLLLSILTCGAQTLLMEEEAPDSTIAVIGYFCKNDSMKFHKSYSKIKIVESDTTITEAYTEDFLIVVTDSTSMGYRMKLIPQGFEYSEESDSIHRIMQSKLSELTKDFVCEFTTDELGCVQSITNWREIRDKMKIATKGMCDTLYSAMPGLDSIMPRKRIENMVMLKMLTEEGVRSSYDELEILFGMHGNLLAIGDREMDDTENGFPQHITSRIGYTAIEDEENEFDGDYAIFAKTVTTIPAEDAIDLGLGALGLLMTDAAGDTIANHRKDMLEPLKTAMPDGLAITDYEYYMYFFNGWPKECFRQKMTDFGLGKHIETTRIEWTMRRWNLVVSENEEQPSNKI